MYPIAAAPTCHRHRPEQTELYSIINEHYPRFLQEIERSGGHLPRFVGQEFDVVATLDKVGVRVIREIDRKLVVGDALEVHEGRGRVDQSRLFITQRLNEALLEVQITAVVIGVFLHISNAILFESSENHKFNLQKFIAVLIGFGVALLSLGH